MVIFRMLSVATVVNHSDVVGNKKKRRNVNVLLQWR